jgi:hypothetical protein
MSNLTSVVRDNPLRLVQGIGGDLAFFILKRSSQLRLVFSITLLSRAYLHMSTVHLLLTISAFLINSQEIDHDIGMMISRWENI